MHIITMPDGRNLVHKSIQHRSFVLSHNNSYATLKVCSSPPECHPPQRAFTSGKSSNIADPCCIFKL